MFSNGSKCNVRYISRKKFNALSVVNKSHRKRVTSSTFFKNMVNVIVVPKSRSYLKFSVLLVLLIIWRSRSYEGQCREFKMSVLLMCNLNVSIDYKVMANLVLANCNKIQAKYNYLNFRFKSFVSKGWFCPKRCYVQVWIISSL